MSRSHAHSTESENTSEESNAPPKVAETLHKTEEEKTPQDGLMGIVVKAVESTDWPEKNHDFGLSKDCTYPSSQLMILEVYCYARGVYESEKIARFCRRDPELSKMFSYPWPEPLLIKRFRRMSRIPIKECLQRIFDLAFLARFGNPETDEVPIDYCVARSLDQWFEPICGPQPEIEAEERIDQAIFWDGMAASNE